MGSELLNAQLGVTPGDVLQFIVSLEHKGVEFYPIAPDVLVKADEDMLTARDRALLDWLAPFIFLVVVAARKIQGDHFCRDCKVELSFPQPPEPGTRTYCEECDAGVLTFRRIIQIARETMCARPVGMN